jgi:pyruvate formate lyase activating enzyme
MKEAMFYEKLPNKRVRCKLCARYCQIPDGVIGFCRVRKNEKGKLYSLVYGKLCSVEIDPIEKKPFFQFAPGSRTLSISTVGCTFHCAFCCNYPISHDWEYIIGKDYTPEQVINLALNKEVEGISYTYTEPTVFYEFAYDCAKMAKERKLYNCFVTNGFTTPEAIKKISPYLDAAVVDLKASGNPKVLGKLSLVHKVEPIFDALLAYKKNKVYVEITNLIIPDIGDDLRDVRKLCKWIIENLGDNIPLHFIRFFPSYKLIKPRTPIETLKRCYDVAKKEGLKYVYYGNVPGEKFENTVCPDCGETLIERFNVYLTKFLLKKGSKCPNCGKEIIIAGKEWIPRRLWKQ